MTITNDDRSGADVETMNTEDLDQRHSGIH